MINIRKIAENKPSVVIHKAVYLLKKRVQRIIDFYSYLHKTKSIGLVSTYQFRSINISTDFDNCDKEEILNMHFFWLGMNGMQIENDNWNTDFLSGFQWENRYYQDIVTVDLTTKADVKIPWELSRFQHLTRLAIIARQEGKEFEATEVIREEIQSWFKDNPYKESVNWTCAMEVSIRAINMIFIALLIPDQLFYDKSFYKRFITALYDHGQFIRENLETYDEYYNNHYLSDLLGLQWIGLFCEEHLSVKGKNKVKKWYKFAHRKLLIECKKQIFEDGTNYESSIAYHRFVTEIFYLSIYIDRMYRKKTNLYIIETVKKMTTFLNDVRLPNGELPMIGDSDDGRILIFDNYSHWNRRSADYLFERKDQYLKGDFSIPKSIISNPPVKTVAYRNSGYYLLRNQRIYCMTHCGPLSLHGHGGHSHNDQLAVVLAFDGECFVVDSGTGSYSGDPSLRNYFRSTSAHSTVEVKGYEQNALDKENLYMMRERTFSKCLVFSDKFFSGEHSGYSSIGINHKRNIKLEHNELIIEDIISGIKDSNVKCCLNYILDSNVSFKRLNSKEIALKKKEISVLLKSSSSFVVEETMISKEYGMVEKTFKISTILSSMENIRTKFILGGCI